MSQSGRRMGSDRPRTPRVWLIALFGVASLAASILTRDARWLAIWVGSLVLMFAARYLERSLQLSASARGRLAYGVFAVALLLGLWFGLRGR